MTGASRRFLWVFGAIMVLTAGTAFVFKLSEFIYIALHEGSDALASFLIPVLNYLLVAAGFACLFLWAWVSGKFKDVESAKYRMLDQQLHWDRVDARWRESRRSGHV